MPDPRIRRTRPHGARHGLPPRSDVPGDTPGLDATPQPPVVEGSDTAARLDAGAAAAAEAEARAQAADDVAGDIDAGAPAEDAEPLPADADAGVGADAERVADAVDATPAAAAEAASAVAGEAAEPIAEDAEPVGWFRDEPIDDGAQAAPTEPDVEPPVEPAPPEPPVEPPAVPSPGGESVVRERDRPVLVPLEVAPPPRRGSRLRGAVIGIVTIAAVAAVGFVAGLMLPTILPGPGLGTTPSPSVAPSGTASPTPVPTSAPSVTPTAPPTAAPTVAPTPAPSQVVYIVKAGDQLARIAATYGVTVAAIQEANNIKDPNLIKVGQKLVIPLPATTPAP